MNVAPSRYSAGWHTRALLLRVDNARNWKQHLKQEIRSSNAKIARPMHAGSKRRVGDTRVKAADCQPSIAVILSKKYTKREGVFVAGYFLWFCWEGFLLEVGEGRLCLTRDSRIATKTRAKGRSSTLLACALHATWTALTFLVDVIILGSLALHLLADFIDRLRSERAVLRLFLVVVRLIVRWRGER